MPAYFKLLLLARQGWKHLPPEQRRKVLEGAAKTATRHGPTVARQVGAVVKAARKPRP